MTPLATFLIACLLLCAVHGKRGRKKEPRCKRGSVAQVLAALQNETYYLTRTTNPMRGPCYFLSAQGLNKECVSGTPVMYGYKTVKKWVNVTEVVAEPKEHRFPSDLRGILSRKKLLIQGNDCFVLQLRVEIELWVTKPSDDSSTCCISTFDRMRKDGPYQTTYFHGVC
uniref:Putative salivary lipocalin n=1 Tax=Ornithodoros turicata TaxID=34597 RepID=A0A2R5L946_9ACAR